MTNANGEPDMFRTVVDVTDVQYANGDHYEMAKDKAEDEGYEVAWCADEYDPGYREYGRKAPGSADVDELMILLAGIHKYVEGMSVVLRRFASYECLSALGLAPKDLHMETADALGVSRRVGAQINFGMAYSCLRTDEDPERRLRARAAVFGERSASAAILAELERLRSSGVKVRVEMADDESFKLVQDND